MGESLEITTYAQAFPAATSSTQQDFNPSPGRGSYNPRRDPWEDTGAEAEMWRQVQPDLTYLQASPSSSWNPPVESGSQRAEAPPQVSMGGNPWVDLIMTPNNIYWQSSSNQMSESGTDAGASSGNGQEEIDVSDVLGMSEAQATEHVFWQYRMASRRWRRISQKPVRRFRRLDKKFVRRKGKGEGKSRWRRSDSYLASEDGHAYLRGTGKGKRSHTSGKGSGRKQNPRGRDGQIMKCRGCDSEEHFAAKCPRAGQASSSSNLAGPSFVHVSAFVQPETERSGPLAALLQAPQVNPTRSYSRYFVTREAHGTRDEPRDPLCSQDPWAWMTAGAIPRAIASAPLLPVRPTPTTNWWERGRQSADTSYGTAQSGYSQEPLLGSAATALVPPSRVPQALLDLSRAMDSQANPACPPNASVTVAPRNTSRSDAVTDRQLIALLQGTSLAGLQQQQRRESSKELRIEDK